MSGTSPESTGDQSDSERKAIPRKRSKVSRACDACRRKKVKCDAEFLATLQKVTKKCTNCQRTNEVCSFSRVPLKRGPTKGYSRDTDRNSRSSVASRNQLGLELTAYPAIPPSRTAPVAVKEMSKLLSSTGRHGPLKSQGFSNNQNGTSGGACSSSLSLTSTAVSSGTSNSGTAGNLLNPNKAVGPGGEVNTPPSPATQPLVKPILHRFKFLPSSSTPPIILPPLLSTAQLQGRKMITPGPFLSKPADKKDSHINGPLWKVPYEMPSEAAGQDPSSSGGSGKMITLDSRRSSLDSVSLLLSAGLRSRLPSLQPLTSINLDLAMSDSDLEEGYVSRARASVLPKNSVSSFLFLNGRTGKLLSISSQHVRSSSIGSAAMIGPTPPPVYGYVQSAPAEPPVNLFRSPMATVTQPAEFRQQPLHTPLSKSGPYVKHQKSNVASRCTYTQHVPANLHLGSQSSGSPDYSIRIYFSRFHDTFPILPFDEQKLVQILSDLLCESPQAMLLVQLFYAALNNLVQFQTLSVEACTALLHSFITMAPLHGQASPASQNTVMVALASLLVISYTLLVKGAVYSLSISISAAYFNDLHLMEQYASVCKNTGAIPADDIQLYLPRLLMCLFVIDDCYALSYGTQPRVLGDFDVLVEYLPQTFPESWRKLPFMANLSVARLFHNLLQCRSSRIKSSIVTESSKASALTSWSSVVASTVSSVAAAPGTMAARFTAILKDKYELYDFCAEVVTFIQTFPFALTSEEDVREQMSDFQLKLVRLVRRLLQSILEFANFVSSLYLQSKWPLTECLCCPFYNVSYGHCFKLICLCKRFVDLLVIYMSDSDFVGRLPKINNDLSISYNLLVSNFNRFEKTSYASGNSVASLMSVPDAGLGSACVQLVSSRLDTYNLSFYDMPAKLALSGNYMANISAWKSDFEGTFNELLLNEAVDGWY